jgi:hypothetical protein
MHCIFSLLLISTGLSLDPIWAKNMLRKMQPRKHRPNVKAQSSTNSVEPTSHTVQSSSAVHREAIKLQRRRLKEFQAVIHSIRAKVGGNTVRLVLDFDNSDSWLGSTRVGVRRGPDMTCGIKGLDGKPAVCSGVTKNVIESSDFQWEELIYLNRDHSVESVDGVVGAGVNSKMNDFIFDSRLSRLYFKPSKREIDGSCLLYHTETLTSDRHWQIKADVSIGKADLVRDLQVRFTSLPEPIRLPRDLWNEFMNQVQSTGMDAYTSRSDGGIKANKCNILKLPYIVVYLQGRRFRISSTAYSMNSDARTCYINVDRSDGNLVILGPDAIDGKKLFMEGSKGRIHFCRDSLE